MKVERNEIKTLVKILKNIEYIPLANSTCDIVFPIEMGTTKEVDGLELEMVNNKFGSEKLPEPVIKMNNKEESPVVLAYCDTTYARKFDFIMFCELKGIKLSKKDEEYFESIDCFLVDRRNVLIEFDI